MAKELFPNLDDYFVSPRGVITTSTEADLKAYLEDHQYSDDLEIPGDEGLLYFDQNLIGSRGNILAINGRAKSRKSVIASAIMSSAFCDNFLGFTTTFDKEPKVLNFDTEQGYGHWLEGSKRVIRDAGLSKSPPGFLSFHSRDCTVEMRLDLLRYALETYRPDVLVIDGVVDLVYDLNSQEESTKVGGEILTWSVKYNCLIIVVIHLTKGNGYMTGALGTYLEKKCQTAIKCELDEDHPDEISNISCQYSRDRAFKSFDIQYNGKTKRYDRTDERERITKSLGPAKATEAMRAELLNKVFNLHSSYRDEAYLKSDGIRKASHTIGVSDMSAKDLAAWVKFWFETQEIGVDPQKQIHRMERFKLIEKATPGLDFDEISPDQEDKNEADLPF